jgi:hypothetical protein
MVRIRLPPAESLVRTEEREGKLYAIKSTRTEQLSRGSLRFAVLPGHPAAPQLRVSSSFGPGSSH